MAVPSITTRSWTGDPSERFTHEDMARVESNLNTMATFYGVPTQTFTAPTRAGQLLAADAQKIEDTVKLISDMMGWSLPTVSDWASGRGVSFRDFDRWESNLEYLHDNGGIIETDGKHTVFVTSSTGLPSTTEWEIRNPSNVVEASGVGFSGNRAYRVSDGTDTMVVRAYGITGSNALTVTSDRTIDMADFVCQMTVASSVGLSTVVFNGYTFSTSGGSSRTITVPRSSSSYPVAVSPSTSPPRYSGLSTAYVWTWTGTSGSASPNAATKTVSLSPTKVGTEILVTSNGSLGIPAGQFDIWAVGGGGAGGDGYYSGLSSLGYYTYRNGAGGKGGEIVNATRTATASASLSIFVGAGGSGGDYARGGDTRVSGIGSTMTARGSYGAGGGGYFTSGKNSNGYYVHAGSGSDSSCQYCGGGGASGCDWAGASTSTKYADGGDGGSLAGDGGASNTSGSDGTVIDGKGYGGSSVPYPGTSARSSNPGGGGGGYGANGGAIRYQYAGGEGGGGGGGVFGGNGGDTGLGGLGYGAGGSGGQIPSKTSSRSEGGGGGGGFGTVKLSGDSGSSRIGGNGAPGCVRITWVG